MKKIETSTAGSDKVGESPRSDAVRLGSKPEAAREVSTQDTVAPEFSRKKAEFKKFITGPVSQGPKLHSPEKETKEKDHYLSSDIEKFSGLVFSIDLERDQPFVEINFDTSIIGDVSWVEGQSEPVLTLAPSDDERLRRVSARQLIEALNSALDRLGPKDNPRKDPEETPNNL